MVSLESPQRFFFLAIYTAAVIFNHDARSETGASLQHNTTKKKPASALLLREQGHPARRHRHNIVDRLEPFVITSSAVLLCCQLAAATADSCSTSGTYGRQRQCVLPVVDVIRLSLGSPWVL